VVEITSRNGAPCRIPGGAAAADRPVFGLYPHGLFESAAAREGLVGWLLKRKGLDAAAPEGTAKPAAPDPFDRLADALEAHVDLGNLLEGLA
jgi:cobyric acid synthase